MEALVGLPRRPAAGAGDFESYRAAVVLEAAGATGDAGGAGAGADPVLLGGPSSAGAPDAALLARLASAAYGSGERVVAHGDSAGAARALVALWRAQWPALRAAFSFRVREVAREGASAFDLTVARRIRGREGDASGADVAHGVAPVPAWLRAVWRGRRRRRRRRRCGTSSERSARSSRASRRAWARSQGCGPRWRRATRRPRARRWRATGRLRAPARCSSERCSTPPTTRGGAAGAGSGAAGGGQPEA